MGGFLRNLGFALVAGWIVMLVALEYFEKQRPSWHHLVFSIGVGCIVLGILVRVLRNARGAVISRRCVRCSQKVLRGQTYCIQHFHESISELREHERDDVR